MLFHTNLVDKTQISAPKMFGNEMIASTDNGMCQNSYNIC